jgi:hypothetical protein
LERRRVHVAMVDRAEIQENRSHPAPEVNRP